MNAYLSEHISNRYLHDSQNYYGVTKYTNKTGWDDYYVGSNLIFSHRTTNYELSIFPEKLHSHPFYEIDIYSRGDITYISDNKEFTPHDNDILIFPPGTYHTARLLEKSLYDRHVFYFSTKLFQSLGNDFLPEIFTNDGASCLSLNRESRGRFFYLLEELKSTLQSKMPNCGLLSYSYILQLFSLISSGTRINRDGMAFIPQKILDIKEYVDKNFQFISSVSDVANQFFYSREYVSRVFKQYYNINLSEYIVNRKIACAKALLEEGRSVSYTSDTSGFRSLSSFTEAFRTRTGMNPSEYKRTYRSKK